VYNRRYFALWPINAKPAYLLANVPLTESFPKRVYRAAAWTSRNHSNHHHHRLGDSDFLSHKTPWEDLANLQKRVPETVMERGQFPPFCARPSEVSKTPPYYVRSALNCLGLGFTGLTGTPGFSTTCMTITTITSEAPAFPLRQVVAGQN